MNTKSTDLTAITARLREQSDYAASFDKSARVVALGTAQAAATEAAALNEVSGNSGELTALVAKWRSQAATNEVNGLEAESIGLTGAAMRHDARQHVLEQAATELEAALAATGKQQGGEVDDEI